MISRLNETSGIPLKTDEIKIQEISAKTTSVTGLKINFFAGNPFKTVLTIKKPHNNTTINSDGMLTSAVPNLTGTESGIIKLKIKSNNCLYLRTNATIVKMPSRTVTNLSSLSRSRKESAKKINNKSEIMPCIIHGSYVSRNRLYAFTPLPY